MIKTLFFNHLPSLCMSAGRAGRTGEAGTHPDWQSGPERWEQRGSGQGQLCFGGTATPKRAGVTCQIIPLSSRCSDVFISGPEREIGTIGWWWGRRGVSPSVAHMPRFYIPVLLASTKCTFYDILIIPCFPLPPFFTRSLQSNLCGYLMICVAGWDKWLIFPTREVKVQS